MRHANLHRLALERLRVQIEEKIVDLIEAECVQYTAELPPSDRASLLDALALRVRSRANAAAAEARRRAGIDVREE